MTLDEIFVREFNKMMNELKAAHGYINLTDIALPESLNSEMIRSNKDIVIIGKIDDEYYSKLSGTTPYLWGRGQLMRRAYDYRGEYIIKDGKHVWKEVTCPSECVAVVSDISIGVPTSHKPNDRLEYVDMISRKTPNGVEKKYVYIIPKKYCYKVNQTALVLSWNKLRVYYSGIRVALQSGHMLYMYIIPHKPTSSVAHNYRVIMTKPSNDYANELVSIRDYWVENNIIFNPAQCVLSDQVKGMMNPALQQLDGVLDDYVMFDANKPLDIYASMEDMEGDADEL